MKRNNVWKSFLMSDLAGKVISVFKDIFLGIYFLKITQGNIVDVSMYYITFYLTYLICLLIVNKLQKVNLVSMFRVGIFLNLMQCIILLIVGEQISNYIIPFAIFASIGNAFYYYPEQILIKRVNKEGNFQNYITKDQILKYSINIILPIILGYCISKNSYELAFIVLIVLISISFVFSLFIKGFDLKHGKINLKKFFENINNNGNKKLMTLLSFRTLFRGLSSFGVLSTLITIITFLVVSTELSLGSISSFITVISILVIYCINKYVKRENLSKVFIPMSIVQSIVVIILTFSMMYLNINNLLHIGPLTISTGFLLVLLYNVINGISNPIFETSNSVVYYECMCKQNINIEDEPSYIFWFEIMINISRSFGYLVLIFVSKIGFNLNIIAILIVVFTLMYIAFAYTLNKITRKYLIS
jgi:MFS transporter, YQGE family, putative transporter